MSILYLCVADDMAYVIFNKWSESVDDLMIKYEHVFCKNLRLHVYECGRENCLKIKEKFMNNFKDSVLERHFLKRENIEYYMNWLKTKTESYRLVFSPLN